jgi:hypothetical protein
MLGVDPEFGISVLRLWLAAGSAALLILFCALALFQPQLGVASTPARRAGVVIVGAVLGAAITWSLAARSAGGAGGDGSSDRGGERRSFALRVHELHALALAPGSPLACLDALAGDNLEAACEKALFASPANVAAASSFVGAELTLLAGMVSYAASSGADMDDLLSPLRRSLEADRFGFVAHALAVRDGCSNQSCKALALLRDASRVRTNLSEATLDRQVEHYAAIWSAAAQAAEGQSASAQANVPSHKPVNIDFPTASSIPAVSIMTPEPSGPVLPGVAAAAAANPSGQGGTAHHSRKQTANSPAPNTASSSASANVVEPIWPEPMPAAPPQAAGAPPANAPVQLAPPSTASAGAAARTQ